MTDIPLRIHLLYLRFLSCSLSARRAVRHGPGFTHPPGGAAHANRSVLAYHYYSPPQTSVRLQFDVQRAAAKRLGGTGALVFLGQN